MLGARTRGAMQNYMWLSAAVGVVLVLFGLYDNNAYYMLLGAIGGPLAAAAYWNTIRWVDANGSWDVVARR